MSLVSDGAGHLFGRMWRLTAHPDGGVRPEISHVADGVQVRCSKLTASVRCLNAHLILLDLPSLNPHIWSSKKLTLERILMIVLRAYWLVACALWMNHIIHTLYWRFLFLTWSEFHLLLGLTAPDSRLALHCTLGITIVEPL